MEKKKLLKRVLLGLTAIGPGLFLIGYNIGTGSITTMAKVGAEHGMTLTWALVLSCIFTYILMVAYGKTTIVSGKTALSTIKSHLRYGKVLAIYILIALVIGELLALMGIFGTVIGIIDSFDVLGTAGIDDPRAVTAGIAQALITTATDVSRSPIIWRNAPRMLRLCAASRWSSQADSPLPKTPMPAIQITSIPMTGWGCRKRFTAS